MMMDYTRWMHLALSVGAQALPWDVPVGCVILYEGKLIAAAHNRREVDQDPSAHAEVLALRQAAHHRRNWRLNGCIVIVTLEPCPMCAALLTQARVAHVIYGAADVLQGACGSRYALWQGQTTAGLAENACQQQLNSFFQTRRP